ncbi:hypothetical protein L7F22_007235 [Adiantum nelumboides]|nr:hypothetical protein [Adiantum nelumboides]MCO5553709.1 hypothetical protein [Adiantum nelumboides]
MEPQESTAAPEASAAESETPAGQSEDQPKRKGKVKWFNSSKGYGFITPEEGNGSTEDVFVHQTAIHAQGFRSLQQGEEVEYVAEEGEDGRWRAVEVKGPKGAYVQGAARYGSRGGRGRGSAATSVAPAASAAAAVPRFPRFGGVCYNCGLVGHMSRDCRSAPFYPGPPFAGRGRGRGSGPFPRSCYACGAIGHLQRDCPNFALPS